jgi:hypothetical protein
MAHRYARRTCILLLGGLLPALLSGCIATKVVTTTVGVATKAAVVTVKTTGRVAKGTAGLLILDGEDDPEEQIEDEAYEEEDQ